mgnify:CR=1 FL=1
MNLNLKGMEITEIYQRQQQWIHVYMSRYSDILMWGLGIGDLDVIICYNAIQMLFYKINSVLF